MQIKRGSYVMESTRLNGPADPDLWYWTLYRDGVKINGGIADSEEQAMFLAGHNMRKDNGELYAYKSGERVLRLTYTVRYARCCH